ncbi:hypothetical protein B0H13DRAFT_2342673 [Mycena leptocephala]|nr:hypothetical protein B0H13DRAFT_2342673 [Mycena leptocephala]
MSTHVQGFDSIPTELVAAIFQHCLPVSYLWPSSLEVPLLLAQICRRWREICLDTPRLWTFIAFDETRSIELLKEWLSRARHHLLAICLDCEHETRAHMLVDVVKPYCLQWQDIHFSLPLSALRQLNTCTFPCLERLTLSSTSSEPFPMTDPVIMQDAPLLREAKISYIPYLQVNLPLERLAILHVTYMYLPKIIAVLRCCPNLVDFTRRLIGRGDHDVAPTHLELRALRSLTSPNDQILNWLTLPRLERLQMGACLTSRLRPTSCMHSSRARPAPSNFCLSGSKASSAMAHTSNASSAPPTPSSISSADVLPWLKRLEVHHWTTVVGDPARPLLDMLAWRRAHGVLESFELVVIVDDENEPHDVLAAAVIAEFRALGEAGLEVRIIAQEWGDSASTDVVLLDTLQLVNSS